MLSLILANCLLVFCLRVLVSEFSKNKRIALRNLYCSVVAVSAHAHVFQFFNRVHIVLVLRMVSNYKRVRVMKKELQLIHIPDRILLDVQLF